MDKFNMQIIASIFLVAILITITYLVIIKQPEEKNKSLFELEEIYDDNTIVSVDPVRTAVKFIETNGTMGNVEKDITQETMLTDEATFLNGDRRLKALKEIELALIPGNILLTGSEISNIKKYVRDLDYPFIYLVENISASEPSEPENLTVYSINGPTIYKSVKVKVDFDSKRIHYTCPKDITYAGIHQEFTNTERFEDIEVILVQSGELWFVYDITDSEHIINERFASWSGVSPAKVNYDKNISTGVFKVDNFVKLEVSTDEE